ncbi:MAG TPA: hypothetical protein VFZ21_03970 [Gemmatimonadaceae bacterium]|nr:hypothetical protein [Gemmatimonadaceae bacterium]
MSIAVRVEPAPGTPSEVEYRWDTDTDILTANLRARAVSEGVSGSVEIEGTDGSWLILDLNGGSIHGVEVAVWPEVRKRASLAPPPEVTDGRVMVSDAGGNGIASIETSTALAAEADDAERTIHFRLGPSRQTRTVRIAREILIDVDGKDRIAGVWLLGVPPFPEEQ